MPVSYGSRISFAAAATAWSILATALGGAACSSDQGVVSSGEGGAKPASSSGGVGATSGSSNPAPGGTSGSGIGGSSDRGEQGPGGFGGSGMNAGGSAIGGSADAGSKPTGSAGLGGASGGAAGTSGASGGATSGTGGQSSGGVGGHSGSGGSGSAGPFVCNQLTGGKLTEEWFIAGFETAVDNARWQVKWREDAYVEVWADANSSFWTAQVDSACAKSSNAPDRLVFGAVSFKYKTQTEWRTGITQAVNNFKAKWPSLRRVDLVTQIRGPQNMLCPTAPIAGETIAVPPVQDAAMADVAAAFPGFVFVGPKVTAHSCSDFQGGGPHLTAAGNQANVSAFSDYFSDLP